jgi:ribosomal-protein-alanine N-acetyltransferase
METKNLFDPFPTLQTSRLTLRAMSLDDLDDYLRIRADPQVLRYVGADPDTLEQARQRIELGLEGVREGKSIRWAITDRQSGAFLGSGGFWRWDQRHFRAEIGYDLAPRHWGKGLMTEAVGAMLRFGFERMGLHSVEANTDPLNEGSKRVLLKLGFRQEGYLRESFFYAGKFLDTAVFSLLQADLTAPSAPSP